eukprot:30551-Pelagococcus_subviridis.AAC.2
MKPIRLERAPRRLHVLLRRLQRLRLRVSRQRHEPRPGALVVIKRLVESFPRVPRVVELRRRQAMQRPAEVPLHVRQQRRARVRDLLHRGREPLDDGAADLARERVLQRSVEALEGFAEVEFARVCILQSVAVLPAVLRELERLIAQFVHLFLHRVDLRAEERGVLDGLERARARVRDRHLLSNVD